MYLFHIKSIKRIVILVYMSFQIYQRNNAFKLLSLIHNQFQSPRVKNFIKYAWFAAGYLEERPAHFIDPVKYSFDTAGDLCTINVGTGSPCIGGVFIKCLWCTQTLCFKHFFEKNHFCKNYVEE